MFSNLQIFRLSNTWKITVQDLEQQLARGAFQRCPSNQIETRGWVAPRKECGLVFALNQQWLVTLETEERLLPACVIDDEVQERAEQMEAQQGYALGRKQRKELKERVTEELLPRAFTRRRKTNAWIDPVNGWLVVDASSSAKAEAVIEHLRHCLDVFPLKLVQTQSSPTSAMSDWLVGGEAPAGFTIDRDCELKAVGEEKSAVRYARHALDGEQIEEEIKAHLAAGKLPTRLALTFDDRLSFVLTDKQEIKRLAFLDILKEEAEKSAEHADEQFDADFALMTGELSRFLPSLVEILGGEVIEQADAGAEVQKQPAESGYSGSTEQGGTAHHEQLPETGCLTNKAAFETALT